MIYFIRANIYIVAKGASKDLLKNVFVYIKKRFVQLLVNFYLCLNEYNVYVGMWKIKKKKCRNSHGGYGVQPKCIILLSKYMCYTCILYK